MEVRIFVGCHSGRLHAMRFFVLLLLSLVAPPLALRAQHLDPYRRLTDPLAICDLGGVDTSRLRVALNIGGGMPDADSFYTVAADYGESGVLRHIWTTYNWGHARPTDSLELIVDGTVLAKDQAEAFFDREVGFIRPPLDTSVAGGHDFDLQIPFRHDFTLRFRGNYLYRAVFWQPIPADSLPALFSSEYLQDQSNAEAAYRKHDAWPAGARTGAFMPNTIPAGESYAVANLLGPAVLEHLHLTIPTTSLSDLQQLWLSVRCDGDPHPTIDVPVADFFGVGAGIRKVRSLRITCDSAGNYDCYFPMPFRSQLAIELRNRSGGPIEVQASYSTRQRGVSDLAYFHAQFHYTPQIRFGQFQPVVHTHGQGRFVGEFVMLPTHPVPNYLEGDPLMLVDSNPLYRIHYLGTEDYMNGGWYFMNDSAFSLPFCGLPDRYGCSYRFHILDAIPFDRSFDFRLGHGFQDSDFVTDYRTVGFFYQRWVPIWCSSDSIGASTPWSLGVNDQPPGATVVATLDSVEIFRGVADASGRATAEIVLGDRLPPGSYSLRVNGVLYPDRIHILQKPQLVWAPDSAHMVAIWRDSVVLRGYGFAAGETLALRLGDSLLLGTPYVVCDASGSFLQKAYVPRLANGTYFYEAQRADGTSVVSADSVRFSRSLKFEIEKLEMTEGSGTWSYIGYNGHRWGDNTIVFCYADSGTRFSWTFVMPYGGTFAGDLYATLGDRFGRYRVLVDGVDHGVSDWYRNWPWGVIYQSSYSMGHVDLTPGPHTLTCLCVGADSGAAEKSFGADMIELYEDGGSTGPGGGGSGVQPAVESELRLYPSPLVEGQSLMLQVPSEWRSGVLSVQLHDLLGRPVGGPEQYLGSPSDLRLATPSLPAGTYFLTVRSKSTVRTLPFTVVR